LGTDIIPGKAFWALALAAVAAACSGGGPGDSGRARSLADSTTRAVWNDDYSGVTANFDTSLKAQVQRSQVGLLSDKLHKMGAYKDLTFVAWDAGKQEYTYKAAFDKGDARVVIRLDANGQVAAYRVLLPQ